MLRRRFPGASATQLASAANAIVGMDEEWDVIEPRNLAGLIDRLQRGTEFRLIERRPDSRV